MNLKILIVEDEKSIRKFIQINIEREGYTTFEAETGEEALEILKSQKIDIIVLDLMLPGISGLEVCEQVRKTDPDIGIIMLTAKSQDVDKIIGLEYGADDYMTKPFNPKELILRIETLSRRMTFKDDENIIIKGPFKLDMNNESLTNDGIEVRLTPTEYSILEIFMSNPKKTFKRDDILNKVWGFDFIGDTKIVDVNIRRLRSKIEEDPANPQHIETVWGVGYRWN